VCRIYVNLLLAPVLLIVIAPQAFAQTIEVIEYRDPRSFTPYWSFEPFKPLPPRNATPIAIPIAINMSFENTGFTPKSIVVSIPPRSYSMAVLNVSMAVTGRQFDRIFWIFANGIPIYWGSTVQRLNSTAEADVTLFLNLFRGDVNFSIVLTNWLAPSIGITGVFLVNVTLYLYPGPTPSWIPDRYIHIFRDANGNSIEEFRPGRAAINSTISIPENTYRAAIYLYTKTGKLDEGFYTNIPSVRDILLYYNEYLAGVFHVFPTIYTGSFFPLYWRPMASVNTHYAKSPQIIDLTPLLALGRSAEISLRVVGMEEVSQRYSSDQFSIIVGGAILAWTDPSRAVSGGSITRSHATYSRSPSIVDLEVLETSNYFEKTLYRIYYEALLNTSRGAINASTYSEGFTLASIYIAPDLLISTLVQNFTNRALGSGATEYSMDSYGGYIIRVISRYTFTPTSDPSKIPYNATLDEDDEIDVWLVRSYSNKHGPDWYSENMYERTYVLGGFSVNLTLIDPYGGAVITALTRASSTNIKTLTALILYSGRGYTEDFRIVSQADLARPFGFIKEFYIKYFRI
jgi:hypothetical protein